MRGPGGVPISQALIVRCAVCQKATAGGRLPRVGRHTGDGTFRYPRRHNGEDGKVCPGVFEEGLWEDPPTSPAAPSRPSPARAAPGAK
jgi:hypothetical protein